MREVLRVRGRLVALMAAKARLAPRDVSDRGGSAELMALPSSIDGQLQAALDTAGGCC